MAKSSKKLFFGGVLVGAIVAPIVLVAGGWVVTRGAADAAARDASNSAVVASLTPICLLQFSKDASRTGQLAKLKALDQWSRSDFVAKNGWATMPGGSGANDLVAGECARRLATLDK